LPLCLAAAFLLPDTQINPATNKKITAQNYCPPCQLGKLPSSRISMDILALRAQNLQQLGASTDQNPQSKTTVLTANVIVLRKIHPASNESSRQPSPFPYSSFVDSCSYFSNHPRPLSFVPLQCFIFSRFIGSLSAYATIFITIVGDW
jgi:hypothetical protein